ncbi:MAG: hypothetical protein P8010_25405, partial [Desulfosarcinaceae bacterium]
MDAILDKVWLKILVVLEGVVRVMDTLVSPLHVLGPAVTIFILVLITVCFTKFFKKHYTTKRYTALKAEFERWTALRNEAMTIEDRDKGKALAKNIDQAKLNKVYYDYFFEGLLNSILTTILPLLMMAAYVNDAYRAEKLMTLFGRDYIFSLGGSGDPTPVSALAWFVLSFLLIHLLWALAKWQWAKWLWKK